MAGASTIVKNFRDGTIRIQDNTGTPIAITVAYEEGNFSISGLQQDLTEVAAYMDRGSLSNLRKTNQVFPTFTFSAYMTHFTSGGSGAISILEFIKQQDGGSSLTSQSASKGDVMTFEVQIKVEGTDFGDTSDHSITLQECVLSVDYSEGDPSSFSVSGTCYGAVTVA
mgnify:FL=1